MIPAILAQSEANWGIVIAQTGAVGIVSFFVMRWLMSFIDSSQKEQAAKITSLADRTEEASKSLEEKIQQSLRGVENANHRLARAQLILVIALNQANASSKEAARDMIRDIDDELKKKSGTE